MPEAIWFELRRQCNLLQLGIVTFLGLGWRHIANRLEEATIVEPADPFESGERAAVAATMAEVSRFRPSGVVMSDRHSVMRSGCEHTAVTSLSVSACGTENVVSSSFVPYNAVSDPRT